MGVAHDVSAEARGYHGRWTRAGAALHRMAGEAAAKPKAGSREDITAKVSDLRKGTGRAIGGHRVDLTQKGKYRVGLRKPEGGRDTKLYDNPADAAKAMHEGKHHEAGGAAKVAGGARDRAVREAARPAPDVKGPTSTEGKRYTIKLSGPMRADKQHYGVYDKHEGKFIITGQDQRTALDIAIDRNGDRSSRTASGARTVERGAAPSKFVKGDRVEIHSGKYAGDTGTITATESIQRPGLYSVKRLDGSTVLIHSDNMRPSGGQSPAAAAKAAAAESGARGANEMFRQRAEQRRALSERGIPVPPTRQDMKLMPGAGLEGYIRASGLIHEGKTDEGIVALNEAANAAVSAHDLKAAQRIRAYRDKLSAASHRTPRRAAAAPAGRTFEQAHAEYQTAREAFNRSMTGRTHNPNVTRYRGAEMKRLEEEMRVMGARRNLEGTGFEMPPKPGTKAHAAEQLQHELASINEQLHEQGSSYTPESLVDVRRDQVMRDLRAGDKRITVKPPSGSEITMSAATAQHLLGESGRQQQAYLRSYARSGAQPSSRASSITRTEAQRLAPAQLERQPVGTTLRIGSQVYTKAEKGWKAKDGRSVSSATISGIA